MADLPEGAASCLDMEACPPCSLSSEDSPPIPDLVFTPSPSTFILPDNLDSNTLVKRLKESNLEKLHTLCKMHLSFLLDLPGSSLEQFLGVDSSSGSGHSGSGHSGSSLSGQGEKHRWFSSKKKKDKYGGHAFGAPLSFDLLNHIQPLLDFLNKPQNLAQEGLFRKSGHIGRQKALRDHVESSVQAGVEVLEAELDKGEYSPHDVASLLKSFLGEMPEPLLTEKHYVAHFQVPELAESKRLQTVQLLLQLLPAENVQLLRSLMQLLHNVVQEESNKMTATTLGTLFAPHILVPRKMTAIELHAVASNITEAVAFMIKHSEDIFEVPMTLMRDISSYWEEFEKEVELAGLEGRGLNSLTSQDAVIDKASRPVYRKRGESEDIVVNTTVSFADRHLSQVAASTTDTQVALAELYAHVSRMPESAKKRKILKQFTKANGNVTPDRQHKRSKSLGESLKKMVSRGQHKRQGSGNSVPLHKPGVTTSTDSVSQLPISHTTNSHTTVSSHSNLRSLAPLIKPALLPADTPPTGASSTRVMRLFKSRLRLQQQTSQSQPKHTPVIKTRLRYETPNSLVGSGVTQGTCASPLLSILKQSLAQQQEILPSSPKVHIVDMGNHNSPAPVARPTFAQPCALMSHRRKHISPTYPHTDQENGPLHMSPNPPKPWFRTRSAQLVKHRKSQANSPLANTPESKFNRPTTFVSPITRSMNNASKSLQTHMMTPGSRKPMAVIQTP